MQSPDGARTVSRRRFLQAGVSTIAGVAVGARPAYAVATRIAHDARTGRSTAAMWLPDTPPVEQLRTLAFAAMTAARAAGADSADVRIGITRFLGAGRYPDALSLLQNGGYGVRAWRGTTWSFQHGNVMTADAIAATARSAAAGARVYAGIDAQLASHRRHVMTSSAEAGAWAPAPVVTGEWHTPMEIDPFLVSFDDLQRVVGSIRYENIPQDALGDRNVRAEARGVEWSDDIRIFASTEGSLVVQRTMIGNVDVHGYKTGVVSVSDPEVRQLPGGVEILLRPDYPDRLQHLYDTVARWNELPFRPVTDIGRFPVVLDGRAMAQLVGSTVNFALDGDRASGIEADTAGRSFLAPALDVLNAPAPHFSPLLTARASRSLPSSMAVGWDDDGVVPENYSLVEAGRVVDFHTTRETAPMLESWYRQHGRPLRSHGGAIAETPDRVPTGVGGQVTVEAARAATSVDDLVRDISHGFLLVNAVVTTSPRLSLGWISPNPIDGVMLEIRNGVPVARTAGRLQFATQSILGSKNLRALGDATTMHSTESRTAKGMPWQGIVQRITAPAALCNDVDLVL